MFLPTPPFSDPANPSDAFLHVARQLLLHTELRVAGLPCRLQEIEFYWFATQHPDPFCHRHPLQRLHGRWYFHRVDSAYRGGSFKGLDLTFSDGQGYGGILLRGLLLPDGSVVSGPSRLVDFLLEATGFSNVAQLDAHLQHHPAVSPETDPSHHPIAPPDTSSRQPSEPIPGFGQPLPCVVPRHHSRPRSRRPPQTQWTQLPVPQHPVGSPDPPLVLRAAATPLPYSIYATARVGLPLHSRRLERTTLHFFCQPYRFLTLPHTLAAGRPQLILALHQRGLSPQDIRSLTRSPLATIESYLQAYHAGYHTSDPATTLRTLLEHPTSSARQLCRLYGLLACLLSA